MGDFTLTVQSRQGIFNCCLQLVLPLFKRAFLASYLIYALFLAGLFAVVGWPLAAKAFWQSAIDMGPPSFGRYMHIATLGDEAFEPAARDKFCTKAVGMQKSQMQKWVGQPMYRGGTVGAWSDQQAGQDIWIYQSSILHSNLHPVRLTFENNRCVNARPCSSAEYVAFHEWRTQQILLGGMGKTVDQALAAFGPPDDSRGTELNIALRPVAKPDWERGDFVLEMPPSQPAYLLYDVGMDDLVGLEFEHGKCVRIGQLHTFH